MFRGLPPDGADGGQREGHGQGPQLNGPRDVQSNI